MKAPDKIYFPADGLPAYIDWDGSPIRTKQVEDSDVCYIRKEALLEWLEYTKNLWSQTGSSLAALQTVQMVIDKINSL